MKAADLLSREAADRREARRLDSLVVLGVVLVLVVAAAVVGGFVLERSHARSEQRQLAAARAELARAQAQQLPSGKTSHVLPSPAALTKQGAWQQTLESVLATRIAWDRMLADLSRVVPASVTLTNLKLGGPGAGGSAASLTLTGKASSNLAVAQLLARLTLVPQLDQVMLGPTSAATGGGVGFSVQAQVKGTGTASSTAGTATTSTTSTTTGSSS